MIKFTILACHLAALSGIESGNNPHAIGKAGERTEYQITEEVARTEFRMSLDTLCRLPKTELDRRMMEVWKERVRAFQTNAKSSPTLAQHYLLWNRPGRCLCPKKRESERAERFANLVEALQKEK